MTSFDEHNAALHLEGQVLDGGWVVGALHKRAAEATGGMFSVSYTVSHTNGRQGFLKVVDLVRVFGDINLLQLTINEYIAERDLLILCGERRLSKVVTAIDHGQFTLPGFILGSINYIIFELATSDVRIALSQGEQINVLIKVEMVHQLATGLRQLHRFEVAHQDLKPSNFLVFERGEAGSEGKIADLGRAFRPGAPTAHDAMVRPGDKSYAPPEQLYRHEYPDRAVRRYAADLYQLGNLIAFIFGGVTLNGLMSLRLSDDHHWDTFGDSYPEALPYVTEAFEGSLEYLRSTLSPLIADDLTDIIGYLCAPDATLRGHPQARKRGQSPFSLERVVAQLDLLGRRLAVRVAAA
ncbi:hypothetical protein IFT79_04660 [Frigoribacterium sp. CFBP 8759]|uniref:protein kinase domain-containing protein n=1 Tax=Frigoribacterium sp. CFBP 8759 TaxID=2775283 RepID=UPI001780D9E7|nr:lipopolysaccharide kinase InaA family protein [Frigoribacterium sp. CFBP 8759]MBD8484901.1 hypothetical protein [Frigoribacterium sp. CFBP 8759]